MESFADLLIITLERGESPLPLILTGVVLGVILGYMFVKAVQHIESRILAAFERKALRKYPEPNAADMVHGIPAPANNV